MAHLGTAKWHQRKSAEWGLDNLHSIRRRERPPALIIGQERTDTYPKLYEKLTELVYPAIAIARYARKPETPRLTMAASQRATQERSKKLQEQVSIAGGTARASTVTKSLQQRKLTVLKRTRLGTHSPIVLLVSGDDQRIAQTVPAL